ncbi:outer membrane protein [Roseixanthobacter glucoisosaccharinicivorans]|uniref:outer membrane protein n=1 Tax=Roseixanthobacter glucoisosaccharinicivorans TaxID=3119923 RepID=UPI00372BCA9B
MLKRALAGVSALALLGGAASAADLATKYPVKAVAVVPVFSWTGFYLGGNVGWGWASNSFNVSPFYGAPYTNYSGGDANGFLGGGQIGYNYQFANNIVLGVEADAQWGSISNSSLILSGPFIGANVEPEIKTFGTIRARAGYAMDRWLPYITGGAAWERVSFGNFYGVDTSTTNWGWTIGGGVEYAFTNNITAKVEYLYANFQGNTYSIPSTLGSINTDLDVNTVRLGVNYKF